MVIKLRYSFLCIFAGLNGAIEIDNVSTQPFRITSITYEHFNGQQKVPHIEFTADIIPAKNRKNISIRKSEQIKHMNATHNGKIYSFDFPRNPEVIIQINTDNQVKLFAPMTETAAFAFESSKLKKTNIIRLL